MIHQISAHLAFAKRNLRFVILALIALGLTTMNSGIVIAEEDLTPPVLTAVSVDISQVNTSLSAQTVLVTKSATDDLSGVAYSGTVGCTGFTSGLVFTSQSGANKVNVNNCAFVLVSGTDTSGDFSATATFPRFAETGFWQLTLVIMEDQTGNTDFVSLPELLALGIDVKVEVTSAGDATPPVLTGVSVDRLTVDTSLTSQAVQVTKSGTDDLSGVAYSGTPGCTGFTAGLVFTSPSGANSVDVNNCAFTLTAGTDLNGDFSATATFPQFAEVGVWQLTLVRMQDQAGNIDNINSIELAALGINTSVEVISPGDGTPPVLTGVSVVPQQVETSQSSQVVQVTKSATDDLSGVAYLGTSGCTNFTSGLVFTSPSGTNQVTISNCAFSLAAGSDNNGDFSAPATFPQFAEIGLWQLTLVVMEDQAGNTDFISLPELQALGIDVAVEVIATSDSTPPVLTGVSVDPQQIDTSQSAQTVVVTRSVTDDLSGVAHSGAVCSDFGGAIFFLSPSGASSVQANNCAFALVSGTDLNGDFAASVTLPQFAEEGIWRLNRAIVADQAGNLRFYFAADLQALGFDVGIEVIAPGDSTPPVLTGVSVAPQQVDTSQSAQTVVVTRSVTDDLSGVAHSGAVCSDFGGAIFFLSPSGASSVQANNCAFALVSGTDFNGDFAASVTLPQFAEEGIWRLNRAIVADQAGNLRFYFAADLQALGFDVGIEVIALADVTPPVLTAFSFTPSVVDVSGGSAAVTVTFEIEDALSGLEFGAAAFVSPSGQQAQLQATAVSATRVSGTPNDGTYEDILTVPVFSESGIWVVERVFLRDEVGNTVTIPTTELAQAGFPTELTVLPGLADVTPPVLTAFSFTPSVVDVSGGSAAVTVTFKIEDSLSGLEFGAAAFVSPSGQQAQLQATAVSATLVSGTLNDGTYEDILTVPVFSESGIWVVERVFLRDEIGNTVTIPTTELAQAGFPTELTVLPALADVTPPVLTAFSFTPSVVDVSGGSAAVTVTFKIEDALSGLEFGAAAFVSPSGQQAQLQATAVSATLVSGTLNDGTYEDILTVPIFSESGIWVVERVFLRDEVGNTVTIPTTELAQAGFPTELTVERNTQPTADAGGPYTVNEGGSVVVTGSGSDPDSDPITFAWDLDNDGTFETPGQSVTLSAAALNGPSSLTITVQVTDTSGLSATDAATVDVLNVAPTVVANDAIVSANEGATANNSGTFSDPGADTVTIAASAGTISQGAGTWNWSLGTTDGPDQTQTVNITATDSDGAATTTTFALTVNNVAPSVAADNATVTVDEGQTANNTGTFSDPGADTVTISASTGTINQGAGTWSWSLGTTDGPDQSQTVTITATDSDGAATTATFALVVNNVAPSVAADNATVTVDEGQTATNTGTFSDPGADTVTISASTGTINQGAGTWSWSLGTTDGPDQSQTVNITATDSDGAATTATFALVVNNVAPSVTADNATVTVEEGQTANNAGAFSDPGADTVTISASAGIITQTGGTWSWFFDSTDGPDESQTVTITATDSDGAATTTTFALTVNNVAPSVAANNATVTVDEGQTANNSGTFSDQGADTVTITASAGTVTQAAGTWSWSFNSTDGPDESQTVTVTATDSDGTVTTTTFSLVVNNLAPNVAADNTITVAIEGATTENSGTFSDQGADTVTITASAGTVTQAAGTWSWSFNSTDGPDESQTVTVTATDSDGAASTATFTLVVINAAPSVAANNSQATVDEGQTAINSGTFSDPGADTVTIAASAGTISQGAGTWNWSLGTTDGPDQSQTVTITATDSDGAATTATFALVVNNVAPSVAADNATVTVDEGQTANNSGTFSDPGADTVAISASSGTISQGAGTWSWSFNSSDGPDNSQTVTIAATDSDGAVTTTAFDLVVNNVAPSVAANNATVTVNEGQTAANTGTFSDPGADTVAITASVGTVSQIGAQNGTWNWSFGSTDGPDESQTVTIIATDSDGASTSTAFTLVVINVAPSVAADDSITVAVEGATANNSGTFSDSGADTVAITASVGTVSLVGAQNGTWSWSFNSTDGPDESQTVTITATDSDGAASTATFTLVVINAAPSVAANNAEVTIDEGQTAINSGTFSDPGADIVAVTASVGAISQAGTQNGTWSWSFGSTDGPAESQTVTITATDSDGAATSAIFDLVVINLAPSVGPITAPVDPVQVNTSINASAGFTDPGIGDTHTAVWDWGDNTTSPGTVTETGGAGSVSDSHTYTAAGVYTVTLTVSDEELASDQSVFQFVVVYDPDGGFVTGGGWIDSPLGAFTSDPSLTGNAFFGFVSKYLNGATTPTGQTEFQFKVADLDFHSEVYDWLVVAGPSARYKGTGTINNQGNYGFMLVAVDGSINGGGGTDKFRIKIWDIDNNDSVVYDNQLGESDDSNASTEIGGGSIIIHN